MARDNKLFQEALKRGSAHAWNEEWDRAAQEYRIALKEFPDDASARTYLAMALYKSGEYRESLVLYQSLWNAQPSNLTLLQRVAELQEQVGDRQAAAISYGRLADAHSRRRSPKDAFKSLQKVVELTPSNPLLWASLVEAAIQADTVKEVIPGYLGLARELALQSRFQEAIQIVEKAISLDASNPMAVQLLVGIRRAVEYWWRANGLGEQVLPEDLERLIPLHLAQQPLAAGEPAASVSLGGESPVMTRDDAKPAITVFAENVTLSVDRSGLVSLRGEGAVVAPPAKPEREAAPEVVEPATGQPPAAEAEASPVEAKSEPPSEEPEIQEEMAEPEAAALEPSAASLAASSEATEATSDISETPGETAAEALPLAELTWDEFEAMTSQTDSAEAATVEAEPTREDLSVEEEVAAETAAVDEESSVIADLEPLEPISLEDTSGDGHEAVEADELEPIEVPPELEAALAAALAAAEEERQEAAREETELAEVELEAETPWAEESIEEEETLASEAESLEEAGEEVAPEIATTRDWREFVEEAEAARSSGRLQEAIALYEESLAAGPRVAQQFVGLGEAYEQAEQRDAAAGAFAQALELTPNLPRALLGLSRVHLLNHRLDSSEQEARRALEATADDAPELGIQAVDLLLDILRERAAYGDLGAAAAGLAWLQSPAVKGRLPLPVAEKIEATPAVLAGKSVAEHLAEIAALSPQARGEVVSSLTQAEEQMEAGKLRSAADEMYRLMSTHIEFLPAHLVLARVLVAQGRMDDAAERALRLVDLYELRERREEGLSTLRWMVEAGLGTAEDVERLVTLLRERNRMEEANAIEREAPRRRKIPVPKASPTPPRRRATPKVEEAPPVEEVPSSPEPTRGDLAPSVPLAPEVVPAIPEPEEPHPVAEMQEEVSAGSGMVEEAPTEAVETERPKEAKQKRGLRGFFKTFRGKKEEEKPTEDAIPAGMEILPSDIVARDGLLRLAESKFAFGDVKGAASLIKAAMQDERIADSATRAALLRVLQLADPSEDGRREALVETLTRLGLPEDLAN